RIRSPNRRAPTFVPSRRPARRRDMAYAAFDLTGRSAVVTGGGTGIGRAIAVGLAQAGADVVPTSRRRGGVDAAAAGGGAVRPAAIEALGRRSIRVTSDVSDESSLAAVLQAATHAFGKVDILVNAAGITKRTPTAQVTDREWNDILDTNLTGTLRACRVFGRH